MLKMRDHPGVINQIFVKNLEFFYTHLHLMPPLILLVFSRQDRSIQSATEMLPLKRQRGCCTVLTAAPCLSYMVCVLLTLKTYKPNKSTKVKRN